MIITGGIYKGQKMSAPAESITRPTLSKVRMGVFNTLYSMLGEFTDKTFMDVFGGSGIMGLEALSRGFKEVLVFEKNPKAAQIIKQNYSKLGLKPNLYIGDSIRLIDKADKKYDVAYVDPPYSSQIYNETFNKLKEKADFIIAEHSEEIIVEDFVLLKTKNYGGKLVSFYSSVKA